MKKPQVSIIIVNYNTGKLLSECVQSIEETTNGLNYEIIVVDNGSSDGSIEMLKRHPELVSGSKKIPKLIRNDTNLGFARAVNQGIARAEAKHVLLLNPDTRVKDGAVRKLLDFAQETEDVGVVGARLLDKDGKVQPSVFRFPTLWRAILEYWIGRKGTYSKYAPETTSPVKVDAVVGAAFFIAGRALKKVGPLNERYFMYFEDLDYCRRVQRAGLAVYYLPEASIIHYHGVSGRSLVEEKNQWRRLIPSSKIYHGWIKHYLINFIIWTGQKWRKS